MTSPSEIFAQWFAPPRSWRVLTEATGVRHEGEAGITYLSGKFVIDGAQFQTPFGTPAGSEGYLIQEVDPQTGQDVGEPVPFREDVLRQAEALYGSVTGLPVLTGD